MHTWTLRSRRTSIRTKLTALAVAMVVLTSTMITLFFIWRELTHSYADLVERGLALAAMTAGNVEYGIYTEDRESLLKVAETVAADKSVVSVIITDQEGRVLGKTEKSPLANVASESGVKTAEGSVNPAFGEGLATEDRGSYLEITAPVVSQVREDPFTILSTDLQATRTKVIGHVRLLLTKEGVRARARHFVVSSLLFTSFCGLVGILLTVVLGRRITHPLKELARSAGKISAGDLEHRLTVTSNDEIGDLTIAFNDMLDRLNESRRQVETHIAALAHANSRMEQEIVQRRGAQEALERLNEELEQRVEERTRGLEEALEELKELDRLKDAFLSSVSHELRTPLTSIRSFSEILLNYPDTDDDTRREFVSIISTESERLTRLVNDVLDLSKIKAGKIQWEVQEIEIENVVKRAVQSQQGLLTGKGLSLQVETEQGLPRLRANEDKIIQVLTNLLSNAIKFTPEGGAITVRCSRLRSRRAEDTGDFVQVSVRDTGVGISAEDLPKLFTPFTQCGHDTLTDKPAGTGLGLSIAKEIITHHGGNIWVESTPGEGSAFHFTIPAVEGSTAGASAGGEDTPVPPLLEVAQVG